MAETADVVIIGSGIVGSSVAYHLAQSGCSNVLVIERAATQVDCEVVMMSTQAQVKLPAA